MPEWDGRWTRLTISVQTLDNLLNAGLIEFVDYLERIPKELIPRKDELVAKLKEAQQQVGNDAMYEQMAQFVDKLPPEQQQQIMNMPPEQQEQAVMQMMNQSV